MSVLDRAQVVASGTAFALIPFFPSFIMFTNVAFPGVSVVPLPIAFAVAVLALAAVAVFLAGLARTPRRPPVMWRPMLMFLGACLLSLVLGLNPRDGAIFFVIFVASIVWHANIERFYAAPGVANAIWWSYLLSGAVACVAAILMVALREPAAQYAIANGRAVGTFVLPGELAGYLLFFLPISFALARSAQHASLRTIGWIACAAGAVAMVLTFSRTGWVGLAAGIAFLIVMRSRSGNARFVQGSAAVLASLAIVLMLFNEHHNPSENYTRLSIWQAALGVIDRFPLTGAGPFGFSKIYPLVRLPDGDATAFHAHSMFLTFLAELGIVGFLAFCWMMWRFAWEWYNRVRDAEPQATLLSTAIVAGLVGALVQGLIDTVSVVVFGLLLSMLALALATARAGTAGA